MLFCALLAPCILAYPADEKGDFAAKGVGAASCKDYLDAATGGEHDALGEYAGYVAGYTSAYNEMTPSTFDAWRWQTMDTVMLLLLRQCEQEPDSMFATAVAGVTRYFSRNSLPASEETRLVGTEEKGFLLYESAYRDLERALRQAGYETQDLYAALMQYKADRGIRDTANIHQVLLLDLIGPTAQTP